MRPRSLSLGALVLALAASVAGAQEPAFRAPGACVSIPAPSFQIHRSIRQAFPPDPEYPTEVDDVVGYGTSRAIDLDSDGAMDVLVPEPRAGDCNEGMHVALYLSRGGCGHRLGGLVGAPDVEAARTASRTHGLPELTTTVRRTLQPDPRHPAVQRTHRRTYRFDGTHYVESAHTQHDGVCHHCPVTRCRVERTP